MRERRRFPRFDSAFEVKYSTLGDAGIEGYTVSRNVSRSGLLIPVARYIRGGDILRLDINIGDKKDRVSVLGKVRWIKELKRLAPLQLDAGVEFTNIDPQDAARLVPAAS